MSQLEATAGLVGEALMDYFMNGRVWECQGAAHDSLAPHSIYPCLETDSWIALACGEEREWRALCRVMGDPGWCREPRFADLAGRRENADALDGLLAQWTRTLAAEEITRRCQAEGVPAAPVLPLSAHAHHPHFLARETLVRLAEPGLGSMTVYSSPIKLSATPGRITRAAPRLGEHNHQVFTGLLGLSHEEVEVLRAEGVIR
jgi:crotonobetainyl-CoA:carnitine CoA-transferase CaiB-like acyl-CoA transferase